MRGCIEQIQTIEREVESLESSQKALGQLRDLLEAKTIEKNELQMRQEVPLYSLAIVSSLTPIPASQ